ncbi:cytochrome P450 4V2-like [Uloborus diversus]|uniref:cytochrome P450 4V2-like n=1 Tax=Uloborus diversus TaxID=327109 RepID=UPI00240A987B|nr:cytochrome P450 4V2-like [Uloborus diversus]
MRLIATCHLFSKEGFYMMNLIIRRLMIVYKAEIIQFLLNHPDSQEKAWEYQALRPFLGSSLLVTTMEKARKRRKIIYPAFHTRIFNDYMEVFNEKSMKLIKELKKQPDQWIDLERCIKQVTLRIICATAMGVQLEANEEAKQFFECVEQGKDLSFRKILQPWMNNNFVHKMFSSERKLKKIKAEALRFIEKVISESKNHFHIEADRNLSEAESSSNDESASWNRKSFIHLLLEAHSQDPEDFTLTDVRDEVLTFIIEGMDTVSSMASMVLMMLGLDQTVQEKTRQEVNSIFHDDPLRLMTYDDLKDMKYLDCVIKETLRLYPTTALIAKEIGKDMLIGDYQIPGGTGLVINLYMLHRDPNHFPNPELFDPDRFLPENSIRRHPFAYMPFSAGARNCIGQRFAKAEMKCLVANILRRFQIQTRDHRDKLKLSWEITTVLVDPVFAKFIPC